MGQRNLRETDSCDLYRRLENFSCAKELKSAALDGQCKTGTWSRLEMPYVISECWEMSRMSIPSFVSLVSLPIIYRSLISTEVNHEWSTSGTWSNNLVMLQSMKHLENVEIVFRPYFRGWQVGGQLMELTASCTSQRGSCLGNNRDEVQLFVWTELLNISEHYLKCLTSRTRANQKKEKCNQKCQVCRPERISAVNVKGIKQEPLAVT